MKILEEKEDKVLINCAFCEGKGLDIFGIMSYLSKCYACMGKKTIWLKKPVKTCPSCKGTGIAAEGRNYCMVCNGKGIVSIPENAITCSKCNGSGIDDSGNYCVKCKGVGVYSVQHGN
ncbi:MAG: hypothetical protein KKD38_09510 [Candidatus Delongbacteria bacterium]|nr:hypothetical protein [Candidatus Delongbacteria bacterium]MCG2759650.1 hypothetical protein [Candidatus Delongbacteria bacterium]